MPEKPVKEVEAIVLCIDRDDDLGKKAAVKGPIIGEEDNFAAAKALAMADPEDTDLNAILAAIKVKRESEHLFKGLEIVTITGDRDVGAKSDQKINNQLVRVLEAYKPKGIILVTDGEEDEQVIPLIQNETKILSIKTVTVKQARQLESAYFKIQDFFARVGDNPRQAQMTFGLPGILILLIVLLSYFGIPIVEVIFGLIGIYLIAKGFGYDEQLTSGLSDVKNSLMQGNIYRVFNALGLVLIFFSLIAGYYALSGNLNSMYEAGTALPSACSQNPDGTQSCTGGTQGLQPASVSQAVFKHPELSLDFILFAPSGGAINLILVAVCLMATGFVLHNFVKRLYIRIKKFLYIYIAAILIKYMSPSIYWLVLHLKADSNHIVDSADAVSRAAAIQDFMIAALISFVLLLVAHYILKIVFFDYIARKKHLEEKYLGKKVTSRDGKSLGVISKILVAGEDLKGVNVKKKYYKAEELEIKGDAIVVKA